LHICVSKCVHKKPGYLTNYLEVTMLPASALRAEGFCRHGEVARHHRLGAEQRRRAVARKLDAEPYVLHQMAARERHVSDDRPREGHSGPHQRAGKSQAVTS